MVEPIVLLACIPKHLQRERMKIISNDEAVIWCREHGIALSDFERPDLSDCAKRFDIPNDAQKRVALVSYIMQAYANDSAFLVWFDDWAVWPSGQRMHIFDRFRNSYGEPRRLIDSPGHIFDQNEIEDATSFVTIAALFLWDCYIVTAVRAKLLFLSHDKFGLSRGIDVDALEERGMTSSTAKKERSTH
jgi:hypothetical protein